MAYFLRLPFDLQLSVLQTWISCAIDDIVLLRALAVLDIACTNREHRASFLYLAASRLLPWSEQCPSTKLVDNTYLTWLRTRKVQVEALNLVDWQDDALERMGVQRAQSIVNTAYSLPSASRLMLGSLGSAQWYQRRLQQYPASASALSVPAETDSILHSGYTEEIILLILDATGHELEELRIAEYPSSLFLSRWQHMRKLDLLLAHPDPANIFRMFAACPLLVDLTVAQYREPNDILTIYMAGRHQLKRFTVNVVNHRDVIDLFVAILRQESCLEYLSLQDQVYDRPTKLMEIGGNYIGLDNLERVLDVCPGLTAINMPHFKHLKSREYPTVRTNPGLLRLSQSVVALTLMNIPLNQLFDALVPMMPALTKLKLKGRITDAHLMQIAKCKELQSLTCIADNPFGMSEAAVKAVLLGCPKLKDLHIDHAVLLSYQLLDAIVSNKVQLNSFTYGQVGFRDEDVQAFLDDVKHYQLPVVRMIKLEL